MKIESVIKQRYRQLIFYVLPIIFFLLGLFAYRNIINSFFVSDDFVYLIRIRDHGPLNFFFDRTYFFYRPLLCLSLLVDYKIWGFSPPPFHITNILIHSLNSFGVFFITRSLADSKNHDVSHGLVVALAAGMWYLFLPSHAETVTWISDRSGLLATFFSLASFSLYHLFSKNNSSIHLSASAAMYLLALFSKESAVTFPMIIIGYEFFLNRFQSYFKQGFLKIKLIFEVFTVVFLFYLFIRLWAIGDFIGGYGKEVHLHVDLFSIFQNIIIYSLRIFLTPSPYVVLIFCMLVSLMTSAMILFRLGRTEFPRTLYFVLWAYIVSVLPVINLHLDLFGDTQGERYVYFPSVFLVMFLVIFISRVLVEHKKYFAFLFAIIIILSGTQLWKVNENWAAAGRISKGIIENLKRGQSQDKLVITHLPDHIEGAYIFRNGIQEAISVFVPSAKFSVTIASHQTLRKGDEYKFEINGSDVTLL